MDTKRIKHIKPAGWLALIVAATLAAGALGLLLRPLAWRPTPYAPPAQAGQARPTDIGASTLAATPAPALPAGWSRLRDVDGGEYLSPPPQDERQIRAAFEAAVACFFVEDRPDEQALALDPAEIVERARLSASPDAIEGCRAAQALELVSFGPENPVRCRDTGTCVLARAKTAFRGVVFYDQACRQLGQDAPCLLRDIEHDAPRQIVSCQIEREEETWIVTRFHFETLP